MLTDFWKLGEQICSLTLLQLMSISRSIVLHLDLDSMIASVSIRPLSLRPREITLGQESNADLTSHFKFFIVATPVKFLGHKDDKAAVEEPESEFLWGRGDMILPIKLSLLAVYSFFLLLSSFFFFFILRKVSCSLGRQQTHYAAKDDLESNLSTPKCWDHWYGLPAWVM